MCGIFGFSLDEKPRGVRLQSLAVALTSLVHSMDERGGHGWGLWSDGELRKGLGEMTGRVSTVWLAGRRNAICHTRFATVGERTIENCHPFTIKNVVLAHNGGIYNHKELTARYGRECPVDSMHLAHHIAKRLPIDELEGYGAVEYVFADEPNAVYLFRSNSQDLHVRFVPLLKGCLWASTDSGLLDALGFAGLVSEEVKIQGDRVYRVKGSALLETGEKASIGWGWYGRGYSQSDKGTCSVAKPPASKLGTIYRDPLNHLLPSALAASETRESKRARKRRERRERREAHMARLVESKLLAGMESERRVRQGETMSVEWDAESEKLRLVYLNPEQAAVEAACREQASASAKHAGDCVCAACRLADTSELGGG